MRFLVFTFFVLILFISFSAGHVGYVLEEEEFNSNLGNDYDFLLSAVKDSFNLYLILATLAVFFFLYFSIGKMKWFKEEINVIDHSSKRYGNYLSWMARIAVSIALIGAGTSEVLISPSVHISFFSTLQIFLGFLIFIGLFSGVATFGAILLFGYALFSDFYVLGNLDFLALCLVILGLGFERPGVSDIFGFKSRFNFKGLRENIPVILTTLMGIGLIFLAIFEKVLNPRISEMVVNNYSLTSVVGVSPAMWVFSVAVIEILIGLCILFRFKLRLVSSIAFVVLSLSFFYFKEAVYSHITLFMALFIIFILGNKRKLDSHYLYLEG